MVIRFLGFSTRFYLRFVQRVPLRGDRGGSGCSKSFSHLGSLSGESQSRGLIPISFSPHTQLKLETEYVTMDIAKMRKTVVGFKRV